MTTSTTTTPIDQTSDAAFRNWVAEIITQLAAVGLTQTADTGQINTSTVTRAAVNTAAGYTIWRFSDTLQSTSPIFLKLEFGSGSFTNYPQMWVSISTGTNGAGTLNNLAGATPVRFVCTSSNSPSSTTNSYPSYFCCDQSTIGYVGMSWKIGGSNTYNANSSYSGFHLGRSNDSTGASTGSAVFLLSNAASSALSAWGTMQCYSYTTTAIYPAASALSSAALYWGIYPLSPTVTLTGGAVQVMPGMMMTPSIQFTQCIGLCSATEIPPGSTFSSALIGSTARTYIQCGSPPGINSPIQNYTSAQVGMFMLWQ
jgi:hypothetical protein